MAEKSGKTTREHLEVLRQHLQGLSEKRSHGEVVDDEDVRMAIFFVDTIGESLPAAPVTVAALPPTIATDAETLSTSGPTLEQYVAAGYKAEDYPPEHFAERDSPGLRKLRAKQAHDTWVAGGKVGPAPGPAPEPEPEATNDTQPASDGSQANGAAETAVTTSTGDAAANTTSTGEQSQR